MNLHKNQPRITKISLSQQFTGSGSCVNNRKYHAQLTNIHFTCEQLITVTSGE